MSVFLAPVPIIHIQAMLDDLKQGHTRFAFGSSATPFFDATFPRNCESENITAYIYASKTGMERVRPDIGIKLGIFIKARLCGWTDCDRRGQYPKEGKARRPTTTTNDEPMAVYWEIDNIEKLSHRKPISDFAGANTSKHYEDGFIPHRPCWVHELARK